MQCAQESTGAEVDWARRIRGIGSKEVVKVAFRRVQSAGGADISFDFGGCWLGACDVDCRNCVTSGRRHDGRLLCKETRGKSIEE